MLKTINPIIALSTLNQDEIEAAFASLATALSNAGCTSEPELIVSEGDFAHIQRVVGKGYLGYNQPREQKMARICGVLITAR